MVQMQATMAQIWTELADFQAKILITWLQMHPNLNFRGWILKQIKVICLQLVTIWNKLLRISMQLVEI